jgi:NADH-quinone oxidoreductase subunit N
MNAIILSAIFGVVMMFASIYLKTKSSAKYLAFTGLLIILSTNVAEYFGYSIFSVDTKGMLRFDNFSLVFNAIALFCTLLYFALNARDIEKVGSSVAEYFALIFFVLCGVAIVSSFKTLLLLFIGIEILSIPLYVLTGADKRNLKSNEAALKYFLMGSFSTGIMLLGIALMYGGNSLGSFHIDMMDLGTGDKLPAMMAAGLVLMLIALSFKVSAAPFHFWTPDVYDGAPTVFTSFMATIVKAAGFVGFIRLFDAAFGRMHGEWQALIAIITAATLLIGNVTAVFQQSVKRMLAYSSIAQAGFMMLAIFAINDTAREGLIIYSAAYSLATIGLFAILIRMKDYTVEGFNGLGKSHPLLALTATIFLLSLTGIPLTAGFTAKFYVLMAAVRDGHQFWLVIFAVICAAISAYYYFRIIQAMYFKPVKADNINAVIEVNSRFKMTLVFIAALLVIFGVLPGLLVDWLYYKAS